MKTFGQALAIGVLLLTFAGCEFETNPRDTINVQTAPDGGLDAPPSAYDAGAQCRSLGKLGVVCLPAQ